MIPQELIDLTLRYSGNGPVDKTTIPQLLIATSKAPTVPVHAVYTPSLCFIVQGEKEVTVSDKTYVYGGSQYLVTSIDIPVAGQVTKASAKHPYLCLVLSLDPTLVFEILRDSEQTDNTSGELSQGIYTDKIVPDLTDAMLRLARTLKNRNDQLILAPLIIREITYRLLHSKHGAIVRQLGVAGSQIQRISKVIALIQKDYARILKTEELAHVANMSVSSFHHYFKHVTTMSPLQYQKQIRLQEARRLLLTGVTDAASAGFQVGYESPSQFSREYARLFGNPPMADVKNLRAKSARAA